MRIEEQERVVEKRRKEIEDNALYLHDGRLAYIDGDHYRDEQGTVLQGDDDAEARRPHQQNPHASTVKEKDENDRQYDELQKIKREVQEHRGQTAGGNGEGLSNSERAAKLQNQQDEISRAEQDFGNRRQPYRRETAGECGGGLQHGLHGRHRPRINGRDNVLMGNQRSAHSAD